MTNEHPNVVPGLARGIQVLLLFDRKRREIGAPDIARLLGLPRTTVFRLLQTLESLELLKRTEAGAYRLGAAVLRIGLEYIASLDLTEIARPVVTALGAKTGLAAQLVIRDNTDIVVVQRVAGVSAFDSTVSVGTRMPAHATILGRVLLSDLSDAELATLYPTRALERYSPQTPKTLRELAKLLGQDRARGYAMSDSYYERGISAVAAPIRDSTERVVAALSVTMQRDAVPASERQALAQAVITSANQVSHQLNYRGAHSHHADHANHAAAV